MSDKLLTYQGLEEKTGYKVQTWRNWFYMDREHAKDSSKPKSPVNGFIKPIKRNKKDLRVLESELNAWIEHISKN